MEGEVPELVPDVVDPEVDLGNVTMTFVLMRSTALGASAGDLPRLFWPGYAYPPMAGEALGEASPAEVDTLEADTSSAASP